MLVKIKVTAKMAAKTVEETTPETKVDKEIMVEKTPTVANRHLPYLTLRGAFLRRLTAPQISLLTIRFL